MKLRTAKKIIKAVGTPDESRYSGFQIQCAHARTERTRSAREATRFWYALMDQIGLEGRARVLARTGEPAMAFNLLMRQGD